MIFPTFSLCFGICDISFWEFFALVDNRQAYDPMDLWCAGGEALFLGIGIIIWTLLHIILESGVCWKKIQPDKIPWDEF